MSTENKEMPEDGIRVTGEIASGNFSESLQDINVEEGDAQDSGPLLKSRTEQPEEDTNQLVAKPYNSVRQSEVMEKALTDDIYSLLYTSKMGGLAFWFAVATFVMQISILVLICK